MADIRAALAEQKPMHPLGLFIGAIEYRLREANIARRREIIAQRVRIVPAWDAPDSGASIIARRASVIAKSESQS